MYNRGSCQGAPSALRAGMASHRRHGEVVQMSRRITRWIADGVSGGELIDIDPALSG